VTSPLGLPVGEHDDCLNDLRDRFAGAGVEVTVSTATPLIRTPYTNDGWKCPHGYTYWVEPTSEQIAAWTRDGVR
jgi:hypothetical protein